MTSYKTDMRVLHVLSSNSFSGAENVVCQIVRMFEKDKRIKMIYCSPDGPIRKSLIERNVTFFPLKKMSVKELRRAIRKVRPDVIHAHDMKASVYSSVVCGSIKVISHIHNNSFESRKISFKTLIYASRIKRFSHIFWVSGSAKDGFIFQKAISKKSSVLMNLVDIEDTEKRADEAVIRKQYDIVYVGRLTFPKNPQRLIKVLAGVIKKKNDITIGILGRGDLYDETKRWIKQSGISDKVEMPGFVPNPYGVIREAKMMILTSRWEGTPMCALEAMALGTPIISTPTDGLKDLIIDGENGYLCETDEGLIQACVKVLRDELLRKKLSDNSRNRAEKLMNVETYRGLILEQYET